jgi:hypothetical protein
MTKAERPLSVQSGDLGGDAGQRARRANSRPSCPRLGTGKSDPLRSLACVGRDVGLCPHCRHSFVSEEFSRRKRQLVTAIGGQATSVAIESSLEVDFAVAGLTMASRPQPEYYLKKESEEVPTISNGGSFRLSGIGEGVADGRPWIRLKKASSEPCRRLH